MVVYSNIIQLDSMPPSNLELKQIKDGRVLATWKAPPNPVMDYRVFINNEDYKYGEGHKVTTRSLVYTSSGLGETVTFHVIATTHHYWSDALGPQSIQLTGKYSVTKFKQSHCQSYYRIQLRGRL